MPSKSSAQNVLGTLRPPPCLPFQKRMPPPPTTTSIASARELSRILAFSVDSKQPCIEPHVMWSK